MSQDQHPQSTGPYRAFFDWQEGDPLMFMSRKMWAELKRDLKLSDIDMLNAGFRIQD